ncbi:sialate O-acetylesterase [Opitutus sp. ER46]|uniref:sialate O-acetylesterase n=1 Tax=Opitutus sp. ER46 TaxID=2161864 RepID=UPI000D30D291|nr:sialate O-acetylesterase [Opitutus sp. ER46]PTX95709.1 sialate O-acetylesterase [Opitutus sp. ER46]
MRSIAVTFRLTALAVGWVAALALGRAEITLAPLFRDGAVVQRDQPLPVWGWAAPGENLKITFHSQSVMTKAGEDGSWLAMLAPEPTAAQPAQLVVQGSETRRVDGILVGDVWLCSGQSNMEFRVSEVRNAEQEIAAATFPLIRHFKIPHLVAERPQRDCPGAWETCSPETVGAFTAVGFFFACEYQARTGVPIGLVNASWGGTFIEAWMSPPALAADPAAAAIQSRWKEFLATYPERVAAQEKATAKWTADAAAAKAAGKAFNRRKPVAAEGPGSRWMPSGIYHAMIAPLLRARFCGVLWYQGEANALRAAEYQTLFPGMIRQWRAELAAPELPFYFVQLANYGRVPEKTDQAWAFLRESQMAALALPRTGMAVTLDIGDATNIHPKNKQEVGRRLALVARHQLLGEKQEYSGPLFAAAQRDGTALRVTFTHADGLRLRNPAAQSFEVAGADRVFVPAEAKVAGDALIVSAASVPAPVAVRYAWRNAPDATLFNAAGLPAAPFRSDRW